MNRVKRSHRLFTIEKLGRGGIYFACCGLVIVALIFIIGTTCHIHAYLQEPTVIEGRLDGIEWNYPAVAVHVNGDKYVLRKEMYSKRTFGIIENKKLGDLMNTLDRKVGREVHLECVRINSKTQDIIGLTIDDVVYVDKSVAVGDFVGYQKTFRYAGIVILAIAAVLFVLARKGKIGS